MSQKYIYAHMHTYVCILMYTRNLISIYVCMYIYAHMHILHYLML